MLSRSSSCAFSPERCSTSVLRAAASSASVSIRASICDSSPRKRPISPSLAVSWASRPRIIFSSPSMRRSALRNCAEERCSAAIFCRFSCNNRSIAAMSASISSIGRRTPSSLRASATRFSRVRIRARFSVTALMSAKTTSMSESFARTTASSESRCTTVCSATRRLTHDTNAHAAQSIGRQICFIISDGLIVITASKISRKAAGCTKKTHRRRPPA